MSTLWHEMDDAVPVRVPDDRWLVTFADLVALLLVFFVLLFSMKEINRDRWEELTGSFQGVFSPRDAVVWQRPDNFNNAEKKPIRGSSDALVYLDKLLQRRMAEDAVWQVMEGELSADKKELRYRLPPLLADSGTELSEDGKAAVARLAALVRNWDNDLLLRVVAPVDGMVAPFAAAVDVQKALIQQGVKVKQAAWHVPAADLPAGTWLVVKGAL